MEKFSSTFAIGFRELFRILVPGLLCITFIRLEFDYLLFVRGNELTFSYLLIVAFFMGLIIYVVQPYRYIPPWCSVFKRKVSFLGREVKNALGAIDTSFYSYHNYNPVYKYFLETEMDRSFVERVHYFTSFYYLLVQISVLLTGFAITDIVLAIVRSSSLTGYLAAAFAYLLGALFFFLYSSSQLTQIIDEQVVMVRVKSKEINTINKGLESREIKTILTDTCASLLKEIVIDPNKQDYEIECKEQYGTDLRTGLDTVSYVFQITTSHPISLSGEPGGFKGFYKERVESVLNHIASQYHTKDTLFKVFIEIVPNMVNRDVLESLIPLDEASKSIVTDNSPVLKVAKKYDMKNILVRGRHLIGPNPGLVEIVDNICNEHNIQSALDLFAGTGIVSVVLKKHKVPNITCVDNGKHFITVKKTLDVHNGISCVVGNVFDFAISSRYDLIVADPYYEDSIHFLNKRLGDISNNTDIFVFVCCGEQNEYLRSQCDTILKRYFDKDAKEQLLFGQSIFICKK